MNTNYEGSIEVETTTSDAYACWSRLRDFPRFVPELEEVEPIAANKSYWHARIAGLDYEWTAEVTERIPGRRIAWNGRGDVPNAGCVTFHRLEPGRTRVMLQLDYRPEGLIAAAGDILRLPHVCLNAALKHFKDFVEGDRNDVSPSAPTRQARNALAAPRLTHQPGLPPGVRHVV